MVQLTETDKHIKVNTVKITNSCMRILALHGRKRHHKTDEHSAIERSIVQRLGQQIVIADSVHTFTYSMRPRIDVFIHRS